MSLQVFRTMLPIYLLFNNFCPEVNGKHTYHLEEHTIYHTLCSAAKCAEPCPPGLAQRASPCGSELRIFYFPFTISWLSSAD